MFNEENDEIKVENLFELSQFVSLFEVFQGLYKENKIVSADQEDEKNLLFKLIMYSTEGDLKENKINEENIVKEEDKVMYPLELVGNCVSVSKNSPNIEIAQEVLAEIYSNKKITNLLVYGEEEVDYKIENGRAVNVENEEYVNPSVFIGNQFLATPHFFQSKEKNKEYIEKIHNMKLSKVAGFVFDGSNVEREIQQVTDIMNAFLACDMELDVFSKSIEEWKDRMNEAGLTKIEEEVNKQLFCWSESNKR